MKSVMVFLFSTLVSLLTFADIDVNPFVINMGRVQINSYAPQRTLYVRNLLSTAVSVQVSHNCMFDFSVRNSCSFLSGNASCFVDVTFRPMREGYHSCNITVRDSANDWHSVNVSGTGYR